MLFPKTNQTQHLIFTVQIRDGGGGGSRLRLNGAQGQAASLKDGFVLENVSEEHLRNTVLGYYFSSF